MPESFEQFKRRDARPQVSIMGSVMNLSGNVFSAGLRRANVLILGSSQARNSPRLNGSPRLLQSCHGTRSGGELVFFEAHFLHHAHEKIGQWVVAILVEREMLTVLESTPG